jgi:hypothetical protein
MLAKVVACSTEHLERVVKRIALLAEQLQHHDPQVACSWRPGPPIERTRP